MTEPAYRKSFESDENQEYEVDAHLSVHPQEYRSRTLRLIPVDGNDGATRCERIRDTAWRARQLRLHYRIAQVTDARQ